MFICPASKDVVPYVRVDPETDKPISETHIGLEGRPARAWDDPAVLVGTRQFDNGHIHTSVYDTSVMKKRVDNTTKYQYKLCCGDSCDIPFFIDVGNAPHPAFLAVRREVDLVSIEHTNTCRDATDGA
jgi:hypothetical protein